MIDKRTDQLTAVTPALSDLLPLYDVSNPGTKKITLTQLASLIGGAGSSVTTIYPNVTAGSTATVPALIGKTIKLLARGGTIVEAITTGTPTGDQILFDDTTGLLTPAIAFYDEKLTIQYA